MCKWPKFKISNEIVLELILEQKQVFILGKKKQNKENNVMLINLSMEILKKDCLFQLKSC